MKPVTEALIEIRRMLVIGKFFKNLLNSVIVFLVFFFLLRFLNMRWQWVLAPFAIYFALGLKRGLKTASLKEVERKVPELREKLRTVADNVDKDNEAIKALNDEVMKDIGKIRSSEFVDPRENARKIFYIGIIAFFIL